MLRRFLHSEAFRAPQRIAAALLLVYLLQCVWLIRAQTLQASVPDSDQALRIYAGLEQWKRGVIAGTPESLRSKRLLACLPPDAPDVSACATGSIRTARLSITSSPPRRFCCAPVRGYRITPAVTGREPVLVLRVMLGASLWYVARRLYGNAGGYIALALYCFSPAMIVNTAGTQSLGKWARCGARLEPSSPPSPWRTHSTLPEKLCSGTGGARCFSACHWRWPQAISSRWGCWRWRFCHSCCGWRRCDGAVLVIWITAIAVGVVLLFAGYFFEPALFEQGMLHARWINFEPAAFGVSVSYRNAWQTLFAGSPPLALALPVALIAHMHGGAAAISATLRRC